MADDDIQDDAEQATPVQEDSLDEAKDTQINRMAGCARLGKWMLYAALVIVALAGLWRCAKDGGLGLTVGRNPQQMMTKAAVKDMKAKAVMQDLKIALGHFDIEYDYLPLPPPLPKKDVEMRSRGKLLSALVAEDQTLNKKTIIFLEMNPAKDRIGGAYRDNDEWVPTDPWGEMYHLTLDADRNGKIASPEAPETAIETPRRLLAYSSGPDRDPTTWTDNVCSWR